MSLIRVGENTFIPPTVSDCSATLSSMNATATMLSWFFSAAANCIPVVPAP